MEEIEFWRKHSFWKRISVLAECEVGWLVWTDDDFVEAFETECRYRRHTAVLDVYLLRVHQYRSAGARSERNDLGFRILIFEQVWRESSVLMSGGLHEHSRIPSSASI